MNKPMQVGVGSGIVVVLLAVWLQSRLLAFYDAVATNLVILVSAFVKHRSGVRISEVAFPACPRAKLGEVV